MERFTEEIKQFCREYQAYSVEVECREEGRKVRQQLERLCRSVRGRLDISDVGLLLALLDAYEVTRDEGMLQEVLDVVSGNLGGLRVSEESVRLLAYCYYYVEEEECREKAGEMLEELKRRGDEVAEAEKVLEELV